jgi:hypothetical protein
MAVAIVPGRSCHYRHGRGASFHEDFYLVIPKDPANAGGGCVAALSHLAEGAHDSHVRLFGPVAGGQPLVTPAIVGETVDAREPLANPVFGGVRLVAAGDESTRTNRIKEPITRSVDHKNSAQKH